MSSKTSGAEPVVKLENVNFSYGKSAALGTLLCDMLKSVVSVLLGGFVFGYIGAYMAGFFCVLGHIFPVFLYM